MIGMNFSIHSFLSFFRELIIPDFFMGEKLFFTSWHCFIMCFLKIN